MALPVLRAVPRAAWMQLERILARVFARDANPLAQLGAVACLLLLLLLISGIYLYVVFDTSATGGWRSIDTLSRQQPFPGGWLRSMHRYAADGFLLITVLHLLREWVLGRSTGFRRASWLTGVPLLVFVYISAMGGFWLNWDRLGQYAAVASAELLDRLPLLTAALTRNFVNADAVSDRLFSLLVFIHLGVPLLLLFGLWFHLQRIHRPMVVPARALLLGVVGTLMLLAAVLPVSSQAPADLAIAPTALAFDWIVLHLHPLADATSPGLVLVLIVAVLLVLLALPLRAHASAPVAVVDPDHCNGCRRCVDDCPYAAITLEPHPNAKPGMQLAVVAANRCAGCGICAGACPSATPFRSAQRLATGIDLPQHSLDTLRRQLHAALSHASGRGKVVVFGCQHGAGVATADTADAIVLSLRCSGQLPPAFIDYALRCGAGGVVISACSTGACEYRLGSRWTAARLAANREPRLRRSVPENRYRQVFADAGDEPVLAAAIAAAGDGRAAGVRS